MKAAVMGRPEEGSPRTTVGQRNTNREEAMQLAWP